MIIVRTDNLGRSGNVQGKDELCIAKEVPERYAKQIVNCLNTVGSDTDPYFYRVHQDDYVLNIFEP